MRTFEDIRCGLSKNDPELFELLEKSGKLMALEDREKALKGAKTVSKITEQEKKLAYRNLIGVFNHIEATNGEITEVMADIASGKLSSVEKVYERLYVISMKYK